MRDWPVLPDPIRVFLDSADYWTDDALMSAVLPLSAEETHRMAACLAPQRRTGLGLVESLGAELQRDHWGSAFGHSVALVSLLRSSVLLPVCSRPALRAEVSPAFGGVWLGS